MKMTLKVSALAICAIALFGCKNVLEEELENKAVLAPATIESAEMATGGERGDLEEEFSLMGLGFSEAGKFHNDAMEYLRVQVKRRKDFLKGESERRVARFVLKHAQDFVEGKSITVGGVEITNFPFPTVKELMDSRGGKAVVSGYPGMAAYYELSPSSAEDVIQAVEQEEFGKLFKFDGEYYGFMTSSAIFKASAQIWVDDTDFVPEACWFCIAAADLNGAAQGAGLGLVGGPAGAAGGAVAGAVFHSGVEAALQWLERELDNGNDGGDDE